MSLDHQLCQQLDDRLGQFRRDGDVFEQQRLRELRVLLEHDVAGGRRRHQLRQLARQAQPGELHPQSRQRHQPERRQAAGSAVHRHRRRRGRKSGGSRLEQAINDLGNAVYGNSSGTNWCTTIKNRGIKIAILYTDYLAVPTDSWYEGHIAPIQSDIGPALQACASPGLFYDAAIGVGPRAGAGGAVRRGDPVGPPHPVAAEEPGRSKPGSNLTKAGQIVQSPGRGHQRKSL